MHEQDLTYGESSPEARDLLRRHLAERDPFKRWVLLAEWALARAEDLDEIGQRTKRHRRRAKALRRRLARAA